MVILTLNILNLNLLHLFFIFSSKYVQNIIRKNAKITTWKGKSFKTDKNDNGKELS